MPAVAGSAIVNGEVSLAEQWCGDPMRELAAAAHNELLLAFGPEVDIGARSGLIGGRKGQGRMLAGLLVPHRERRLHDPKVVRDLESLKTLKWNWRFPTTVGSI